MCKEFEEKIIEKRKNEKFEDFLLEHISMCPKCRVLKRKNEEINDLLEEITYVDTSKDFNEKVFEKIDRLENMNNEHITNGVKGKFLYTIAASIILFLSIFLAGVDVNKTKKEMPYSLSDLRHEKLLEEIEQVTENNNLSPLSVYDEWQFKMDN